MTAPAISVVIRAARGWKQRTFTLAAWGRARSAIEGGCEFVDAVLVGGLA